MIIKDNQEQQLVERLQSGDKAAAREFYSLYADRLAGICSRYIADDEDLKDVFQDAFIHILTHIGGFDYRGAGSLQAWTSRIVVNQSLKFLRSKLHQEFVRLDFDITDEPEDDDPPVSDIPPDVIRQMLNRLPVGYRTVFNLYVFEGKSHKEIARLLDIKADSSASQLHRAKNMLAEMIREYNRDENQLLRVTLNR